VREKNFLEKEQTKLRVTKASCRICCFGLQSRRGRQGRFSNQKGNLSQQGQLEVVFARVKEKRGKMLRKGGGV